MHLLIVAGGTLGHVNPALALASEWHDRISFVTDSREIVRNLDSYGINIRHFKRFLSLKFLFFPFSFVRAFYKSAVLVKNLKPDIAIGMGGYVTVPVILACKIRAIPIYLCEQNVRPGRANRVLSIFAKSVFISFEESKRYFRGSYNYGNPVDSRFFHLKKVSKRFTLLVLGGTNGAPDINKVIMQNTAKMSQNNISLIHITGKGYELEVKEYYKKRGFKAVVIGLSSNMLDLYRKADLVVCRAGASTLFELAAMKKPAIIVPHPHSLDGHQIMNALVFKSLGYRLINSNDLNQHLFKEILRFKKRPYKIKEGIVKKDAAKNIINCILYENNKKHRT